MSYAYWTLNGDIKKKHYSHNSQAEGDVSVQSQECEIKLVSKLESRQQSIESTQPLLLPHDREKTDKAGSRERGRVAIKPNP